MSFPRGSSCLRAGIVEWPGLLSIKKNEFGLQLGGPFFEIFDIVSHKLGVCVEFVVPADKKYGSALPNGSWSGIIGMITSGDLDISGLPLSVDPHRTQVIDFSTAVFVDEQVLMYKRPVYESDLLGFLKPYTLQIWMLLLATMFMVCTVLLIVQSYEDTIRHPLESEDESTHSPKLEDKISFRRHGWSSASLTLASVVGQSMPSMPRGHLRRMLSGLWLLAALILGSVYRSNLKAMLILPKLRLPFNSMEELLETNIPCFVTDGTMLSQAMVQAPPGTLLHRLRKQAVSNIDYNRAILNVQMGRQAALSGNIVSQYVIHRTFSQTKTCPLYVAKEKMWGATSISYVFPKGSSLRQQVNVIISRLREFGILTHLFREAVKNARTCAQEDFQNPSNNLRPLDLGDFYGVFTVYAGGITLSLCVFLLELVVGMKKLR